MNRSILYVFVLLASNQVFCATTTELRLKQEAELRDVTDAAEKAFKALISAVETAISAASKTLNAAVDVVNGTVTKLEDKAHDVINLAMVPLNEKMDELLDKATTLGINFTKCENHIDDLTNLPNNLFDDLVSCMTNLLVKARDYVDDALKNYKEIEAAMEEYKTKIEKCKGDLVTELKCLAALVPQMAKDAIEKPANIAADVTKISALITGLVPTVEACYTTTVAAVPVKGAVILGKFALCCGLPSN